MNSRELFWPQDSQQQLLKGPLLLRYITNQGGPAAGLGGGCGGAGGLQGGPGGAV